IKDYMKMYYHVPDNFEKFLYVGQVLQAYGIQSAIEAHRRAMPYNMGSLVWQINDCWPVASWSSCDYYHRWKALQYEIKRSFEPIIISAYSKAEKTCVTVVSDKLYEISAQFEIKVCDFKGKVLQSKIIPVKIKANGVTHVLSQSTSKFTENLNGTYLSCSLNSADKVLAQKTYYFTQPKNLQLPKPTITSTVLKKGDVWEITLKSDVLAKDVYMNFAGIEGFFSDNYFDLIPGVTRKITFMPKDKAFLPVKLELISLVDSH
ncbi:MAG: glycoside hydrolase family 2 protein, partial [Paludibacter sp.]